MPSSSKAREAARCLSRILRRVLCFSRLPLCSFDHFKEDEKECLSATGDLSNAPGLMARLMGLESIPPIGPTEGIRKSRSSPSVRRRRIIPPYRELEEENFFVLSFERPKSVGNVNKKQSMRGTEHPQRRNKLKEILEFEIRGDENQWNVLHPLKDSSKRPEKTRAKKKRCEDKMPSAIASEAEDDSEYSSPNSVLEFAGFSSSAQEENSRLVNSKLRRPLSDKLDNCGNSGEKKLRHQNYAKEWDDIGHSVAMETTKSSSLGDETAESRHCLMEIGRDLESGILDVLLNELILMSVK